MPGPVVDDYGSQYQGPGVSYYGGYVKGSAAEKDATGRAIDKVKGGANAAYGAASYGLGWMKDKAGGAWGGIMDGITGGDGWRPLHYPYDESTYEQHRENQAGARGDQGWLADQYRRQISGYGPSVARTQLAETTAANQQQQLAMARSGSGPLGQAGNRYEAARNSAGINQAANRQAASLRAQETALAMQGMGQTAGQMRGQDITMLDTEQGYQVGRAGVHAQVEDAKARQSESEAGRKSAGGMFTLGALSSGMAPPPSDEKAKRAPSRKYTEGESLQYHLAMDGDGKPNMAPSYEPLSGEDSALLSDYASPREQLQQKMTAEREMAGYKGAPGPAPDDSVLQKGATRFPSGVFGRGGVLAPVPAGSTVPSTTDDGKWSWASRPGGGKPNVPKAKTKSERAAAKAKSMEPSGSPEYDDTPFGQGQATGSAIRRFVTSDERTKAAPTSRGGQSFDPNDAITMLRANQQATKPAASVQAPVEAAPEKEREETSSKGEAAYAQGQETGGAISGLLSRFSDKRMKKPPTNGPRAGIPEANPRDMDRFLGDLKPYEFRYKNGVPGENPNKNYVGVMAQDAERTKAGSSFVLNGPDGLKRLDPSHGFGTALAAMGRLNERLERLEQRGRRGGK